MGSYVDKVAYKIDRLIYDLLNLSRQEIDQIEDNLRMRGLYLPAVDHTENIFPSSSI